MERKERLGNVCVLRGVSYLQWTSCAMLACCAVYMFRTVCYVTPLYICLRTAHEHNEVPYKKLKVQLSLSKSRRHTGAVHGGGWLATCPRANATDRTAATP